MSGYLLDVNVLIALAWPSHVLHKVVAQWFDRHAVRGWATCPFTETAFVRILSNPAFSPYSLSPENGVQLLKRNLAHPSHQFWPADITLSDALNISQVRPAGHHQITDIYLLGLAVRKKGLLATCDRSIQTWSSSKGADKSSVELIH